MDNKDNKNVDKTVETPEEELEKHFGLEDEGTEDQEDNTDGTEEFDNEENDQEDKPEENNQDSLEFLDMAYDILKDKYLKLESQYSEMREDRDKYKKFHDDKVEEEAELQKDEIFEKFESALGDTGEFETLKEKRDEKTPEEIRTALSLAFTEYNLSNSKKEKKKDNTKIKVENKDFSVKSDPYDGLFNVK